MIFEDTQIISNTPLQSRSDHRKHATLALLHFLTFNTFSPNCNFHKDNIDLGKEEKTEDLAYAKLNTSLFVP